MMCCFIKLTPSTELTTCQELAKYTGLLEREPEDVLNSSGKQNGQKLFNTFAYHTVPSTINLNFSVYLQKFCHEEDK